MDVLFLFSSFSNSVRSFWTTFDQTNRLDWFFITIVFSSSPILAFPSLQSFVSVVLHFILVAIFFFIYLVCLFCFVFLKLYSPSVFVIRFSPPLACLQRCPMCLAQVYVCLSNLLFSGRVHLNFSLTLRFVVDSSLMNHQLQFGFSLVLFLASSVFTFLIIFLSFSPSFSWAQGDHFWCWQSIV